MRARLRAPACTLLRARHTYLRAHMRAHARTVCDDAVAVLL